MLQIKLESRLKLLHLSSHTTESQNAFKAHHRYGPSSLIILTFDNTRVPSVEPLMEESHILKQITY